MSIIPLPKIQPACSFADVWTLYPRKVARLDALKAWDKLSPADQRAAGLALIQWRRVWLDRGDLEYVPYMATWIRGQRWEDELPAAYRQKHQAHQPAIVPAEPEVRAEMPDSFRALVAKLKGQG